MTTQDPTHDEMVEFLQSLYGSEIDDYDIESAIYWFASSWHGGQDSNLYSALSTSPYSPGPIATGPEPDSMGEMCFEALEAEYTTKEATP